MQTLGMHGMHGIRNVGDTAMPTIGCLFRCQNPELHNTTQIIRDTRETIKA